MRYNSIIMSAVIFAEIADRIDLELTRCVNHGLVMSSYDIAGLIDEAYDEIDYENDITDEELTEFAERQVQKLFLCDKIYIHAHAPSYLKNVRECGLRSVTEAVLAAEVAAGRPLNGNYEFPVDATGKYVIV